ncbi:Sickle tail protein [Collichthys lucidus]|uniref:Sickle tail protein n=1 Tax=Collichthys lucidus TaxID=240159 RepID=A0A4U5V029_COLLU|nr:Sickle tail protein [Collichthys lucidus]
MVDAGVTGIPGVMQQYRATIKPLIGYRESMEHQTHSLRRMIDEQIIGGIGLVSPKRMSPVRRSLWRDSNRATVEIINRSIASGSSSSTSSVFVDSPVGQPERAFQGHVTANDAQSSSHTPLALQVLPSDWRLRQSLVLAKGNLSNQESVSSMLRVAGQELMVFMCDRLAQSEETVYRQRMNWRTMWTIGKEALPLVLASCQSLRDVEEEAVKLRKVGEAVAILKDKFSELQLRSVLRLEVEVVRFLKEEPHKMDLMLKRVKALTEALSALRRCVSDSAPTATSAQVKSLKTLETDHGPSKIRSPQSSPKPHPRSSVRPPVASLSQDEVGPAGSASPILFRRMKSGAATMIQPSHHHPNPPLTPTHGRDSPSVAKVSPCNREGSPGLQKTVAPLQSDQLCS